VALSGSAPRRYAEAMLDLATAEKAVDAYRAALDSLAAGLTPQAIRALRNPSVPVRQRLAAVDAATKGQPKAIRSLLLLLEQRDRLVLLPDIARAFGEFVERLEKSSRKKLKATFAVDPGLIGGARVQLGDHLVDSSVRAQLNALRQSLAGN